MYYFCLAVLVLRAKLILGIVSLFPCLCRISSGWACDTLVPWARREPHYTRIRAKPRATEVNLSIDLLIYCSDNWSIDLTWHYDIISYRVVNYETGKGGSKARSLWRLEPLRIRWNQTLTYFLLCMHTHTHTLWVAVNCSKFLMTQTCSFSSVFSNYAQKSSSKSGQWAVHLIHDC